MKVSVLMITYNHEKYIAQAVNSVLMQQVNFDYELVVGEDCSTDSTRDILLDFVEKYPDKIRLLSTNENLGAQRNFARTYYACQGQYIALLEGDDYWTSPHKLQKQVDYLNSHPECVICFHNVIVFFEDGNRQLHNYCPPDQKEISTLQDLLSSRYFLPTASVIFRNGLIGKFPDWFFELKLGDRVLHILNAQYGKIGYINEILAAYRKHSAGIWTGLEYSIHLQQEIFFYQMINAYLGYRFDTIIRPKLQELWNKLAVELIERGFELGLEKANLDHVKTTFKTWSSELPITYQWKAQVLGQIYERLFFTNWNNHDYANARYCWLKMVQFKFPKLNNRGIWSAGFQVFSDTDWWYRPPKNFLLRKLGKLD